VSTQYNMKYTEINEAYEHNYPNWKEIPNDAVYLKHFAEEYEFVAAEALGKCINKKMEYLPNNYAEIIDNNTIQVRDIIYDIMKKTETKILSRSKNGYLMLQRMLQLQYNPIEAIQKGKRDIGIYWVYKKFTKRLLSQVMPEDYEDYDDNLYQQTQEKEYIFTCLAELKSVDWNYVIPYNSNYSESYEIKLLKNSPLILTGISEGFGNNLDISTLPKTGFTSGTQK
jgi:hypothetical protein